MAYLQPEFPEEGWLPDRLTAEDFQRRFPGENDRVEFKTGTGNQPLQDAIVAFSNAEGGVIFVGVNDEGGIVGRELSQGTLATITQAFRDTRGPGRYEIREIRIDETPLVAIVIAKRINGFAQTSNGRVLARRGTQKAPLFGDELRRLLIERSLVRFEQHDSGVELATISRSRLKRVGAIFDRPSGDGSTRDRLRERGLLLSQSAIAHGRRRGISAG